MRTSGVTRSAEALGRKTIPYGRLECVFNNPGSATTTTGGNARLLTYATITSPTDDLDPVYPKIEVPVPDNKESARVCRR